ncbi:hypothetical protein ACFLXQ_04525 [Chloroflexota bacterium]
MEPPKKLTRRKFLKIAGIASGIIALPTLVGYDLFHDAQGEFPSSGFPYSMAKTDVLPLRSMANSPILILTNERSENPFGIYLTEILRTEGLNCFQVSRLSAVDHGSLEQFDLVLLAEGSPNTVQREMLEGYVAKGGRLVAMRPDPHLAFLFGVERVPGSTAEGYLQVETDHPMGKGIALETLQFHGEADHYRLAGAQPVAWLASDANSLTDFPAITVYGYGQGQTALWAFDLARSIAYTRQGNPIWANQERDRGDGIRATDMFKGWINLDRLAIPQADEQQRLLVNLLTAFSEERRPLPRLWYFPGQAKGMLVATGDAHKSHSTSIEEMLKYVEHYNGHMSIYYAPDIVGGDWKRAARRLRFWATDHLPVVQGYLAERFASPTAMHVEDWRSRGHEFTLHPYVEEGLEKGWHRYWQEFTGRGYGSVSSTVRTHRILWEGWVETARLQASYGIRMNLDYYHWGPLFQREDGKWTSGYLTGSGLPMRFVDEDGRILNIYQQLTELADDHMLDISFWDTPAKLTAEEAVEVSRTVLRNSLEGAPSAIVAQFHADPFSVGGEDAIKARHFLEGTLEAATLNDMPIWSAQEWLCFTELRHDANFEEIQWQPATQRLSFQLVAQEAPDVELTIMIPLQHNGIRLTQVEVDGQPLKYDQRTVGGVDYGWVSVSASPHKIMASYS